MPATVLALVPTYNSHQTLTGVIEPLIQAWPFELRGVRVVVVDDGSTDPTRQWVAPDGVSLIRHAKNRGKGAALRTGFFEARRLGADAVVTIDGDGQHLTADAVSLALHSTPVNTLLLGARNLADSGAPGPNRVGNDVANFFLSWLGGKRFADTQCGLRRYPLKRALASRVQAENYAYESELLLRAAQAGWQIDELAVNVHYPTGAERISHYRAFKDTAHITTRIVVTALTSRLRPDSKP